MGRFSKEAIATLIVSAFVMFAVACSSNRPNDEAIAQDIQAKVAADPATRDAAVSVTAKDGKVSLKGSVKDTASQQRLEQIAREEPGATGVDDQTAVVADPGSAPEQAASTPAPTASPQAAPPPPREAPKPKPIVVPAGTPVTVTVDQALSSKTSKSGQTFLATVAQPVTVNGTTVIPKGASATGTVLTAKSKGKIKGEGELSITLASITIHEKNYPIQTANLDSTVKGKGKRTAATTGGGAAGGALIGGLAGGGKGAGIGALVGAGAGLVGGALTGNKQVEIPAETALTFTLANPLTLPHRKE
jgi:BON domain